MVFKRAVLHTLLIFAVLSATISPACAFISGQNATWVEICSGISAKLVKIDEERETAPDMTSDSCAFCFASSHISAINADVSILALSKISLFYNQFITETALIRAVKTTHARAPPALLSL
ncbi:MAG: hypothetical protein COB76_05265 [Alphaproteobacteria bacterium]|nr:MAG: hypothetical protein COB76_05265 [Alphaproteobacteria bacterium]